MESTLSSIVPILKFFANTLLNKDKKNLISWKVF